LEQVRKLPQSDIEDWKARYNRCPWGPKAEADRSAHMLRYLHFLCVKKDSDHLDFSKDKTEKTKDEILIELGAETPREQTVRNYLSDNTTSPSTIDYYNKADKAK